ncbi:MAG: hypothetical protein IH948_07360 [Bacteroidetes bacterium]|nr:hypothetical protein [Bacteroidota bacterium]
MAVARKQLIEVFLKQCDMKEDLVPGYREELLTTVTDIILKESEHMEKKTTVQRDVDDLCDRLASWCIDSGYSPV